MIVQHRNPITGVYEEKHFNETIPVRSDTATHLYTLHLRADNNQFEVSVDGKVVQTGCLLTHMVPEINPPEMIADAHDVKPKDWVDAETIEDATAIKPDDWDESQPRKIPDPKAAKPTSWLGMCSAVHAALSAWHSVTCC